MFEQFQGSEIESEILSGTFERLSVIFRTEMFDMFGHELRCEFKRIAILLSAAWLGLLGNADVHLSFS